MSGPTRYDEEEAASPTALAVLRILDACDCLREFAWGAMDIRPEAFSPNGQAFLDTLAGRLEAITAGIQWEELR